MARLRLAGVTGVEEEVEVGLNRAAVRCQAVWEPEEVGVVKVAAAAALQPRTREK